MTTTTTSALSQITATERKLTGAVDSASERLDQVAGETLESALHRLALAAEGARQRLADATFRVASIVSDLLSDIAGLGDEITEQLADDREEMRREEEIRQEALRIYTNGQQAREAQGGAAVLALPDATSEEEPLAVRVAANGPVEKTTADDAREFMEDPAAWIAEAAGTLDAPQRQESEEPGEQQPQEYTTGQAAKICGVARRAVVAWFDSGKLAGYRTTGNDRRIPREALEAFMRGNGIVPGLMDNGEEVIG